MSIHSLPPEMLIAIFDFLEPREAQSAVCVCREWHVLILESQTKKAQASGRWLAERCQFTLPVIQAPSIAKIQTFYIQCHFKGVAALLKHFPFAEISHPLEKGPPSFLACYQAAIAVREKSTPAHLRDHPLHLEAELVLLSSEALNQKQPALALENAAQLSFTPYRNKLLQQLLSYHMNQGNLAEACEVAEMLDIVPRDAALRSICIAYVANNQIATALSLVPRLTQDYNQYLALHAIYAALQEPAKRDPEVFAQVQQVLNQMPSQYRASAQSSFTRYLFEQGSFFYSLRSFLHC